MSACRNSALSSKLSFASSAITRPSPVRISGLISASDASVWSNARYRPCNSARASRDAAFGNADLARDAFGIRAGQALAGIDEDLVNLLRRLGGDFLDVHAAFRARHQHHALRRAIDDHADVELLLDVGAFLDQQTPHLLPLRAGLVGDELHAEDLIRQLAHFGNRLAEFDAATLAAAAGMDLRLDDPYRSAQRFGRLDRFVDRKNRNAARRRDAEPAQDFLALVLVDFQRRTPCRRYAAPRYQRG